MVCDTLLIVSTDFHLVTSTYIFTSFILWEQYKLKVERGKGVAGNVTELWLLINCVNHIVTLLPVVLSHLPPHHAHRFQQKHTQQYQTYHFLKHSHDSLDLNTRAITHTQSTLSLTYGLVTDRVVHKQKGFVPGSQIKSTSVSMFWLQISTAN